MSIKLELHFSRDQGVALEKVYFSHPLIGGTRFSVRGKLGGAYGNALTFQWTPAVQALMLLALDEKISHEEHPAILAGGAGSAAASLDYAIGKQPAWLLDMFGVDSQGQAVIRRLIRRTNPERKRGGDVLLSLNPNQLKRDQIRVSVNGAEIGTEAELRELREEIASSWRLVRSNQKAPSRSAPAAERAPTATRAPNIRILIGPMSASDSRSSIFAQLVESRLVEHLMSRKNTEAVSAQALLSAQDLDQPAGILGKRLNCALVAVGRVEMVNQTVRCLLQLVTSESGKVVWMKSLSGKQREFADAAQDLFSGMEAAFAPWGDGRSDELRPAA